MGYETINVTPVTPRIGAEVDGLTLAKLHQALAEHQVLFFRDQPLDVEGHKAFGRYFGDLNPLWCGIPLSGNPTRAVRK